MGNAEGRREKSTLSSRQADWLVRSVETKERRPQRPSLHNQQAAAGLRPQLRFSADIVALSHLAVSSDS